MPQSPSCPSCMMSMRSSPVLVITVVFVAMMLDVILMTAVDPILPAMLANMWAKDSNTSSSSTPTLTTGGNAMPTPRPLAPSAVHTSTRTPPGVQSDNYMELTLEIGVLVAAKPLLEMMTNIAVGSIVDRCGHRWPMLLGFIFNFAATVGFGYAPTYGWLLATRLAQAVGSSLSVVSGLAFLAAAFPDDQARCDATAKAFGGISLGIIIGYPYGSVIYQFLGPQAPFLILGALTIADGALRMLIVLPQQNKINEITANNNGDSRGFWAVLADPYILVGLGCSFVQHFGLGVFLATGPAWMLQDLHAQQWNIGVVLAVAVLFHFTAQCIAGKWAIKVGRWLFCWVGMILFACGLALYPLCTNIWEVLGPEITVRLGHGTVLCVISPMLARIADIRHNSQYGVVYGLYTASYNLGLGLGPIIGGELVKIFKFQWVFWGTAGVIFMYSFLALIFRRLRSLTKIPLSKKSVVASYGAVDTNHTNPKIDQIDNNNSSNKSKKSGESGENESCPHVIIGPGSIIRAA